MPKRAAAVSNSLPALEVSGEFMFFESMDNTRSLSCFFTSFTTAAPFSPRMLRAMRQGSRITLSAPGIA